MSPRRLSDDPAAARIALSLILAVAFAWRLVAVAFPVTDLVSDSALYGLMTRHMLEGRFPLFTYGQHYMGSLESVVGAFFSLFVGPSFRALQLSPLLFFMLFLGVLWRLGRELFGPVPALWAVAYAAASPFPLYAWSMSPRGGYPETLFFGTAVLLLALLILRRGGGGKAEWALLGLLSGLGFWTNFLIGYYFLPAGVVLAVGLRRELFRSRTYLGIGAFLVGSLPVWIYNIPRGFPSFRMGALGSFDQAAGLRIFFVRQLPDILGLSGSYLGNHPLAQRVWFVAAAAFYLLLALPFAWVSIKALAAFLTRRRPAPDEGLLLLFLATMALLFSGSRYALFNTSRYLVPVYSVVPLIGASAIARTSGVRRRLVCAGWAALMVVQSVFLAKHLSSTYPVARRDEALTNELLATLVAEGETHGVSEYSQSKRLTYISGERVIVIQPRDDQYPPYETAVERSPRAFFLTGNPQLPKLLAERGVRFRERRFGGRLLLSAIEPPGEALLPIARAGWKLTGAGAVQGWADGLVGPAPAPAPAAVTPGCGAGARGDAHRPGGGADADAGARPLRQLGRPRLVGGLVLDRRRELDAGAGGGGALAGLRVGGPGLRRRPVRARRAAPDARAGALCAAASHRGAGAPPGPHRRAVPLRVPGARGVRGHPRGGGGVPARAGPGLRLGRPLGIGGAGRRARRRAGERAVQPRRRRRGSHRRRARGRAGRVPRPRDRGRAAARGPRAGDGRRGTRLRGLPRARGRASRAGVERRALDGVLAGARRPGGLGAQTALGREAEAL